MNTEEGTKQEIENETLAPEEQEQEQQAEEANPDEEGYELEDGTKVKTQAEAIKHQQALLRAKELELAEANAYRQAAYDLGQRQVQAPVQEQAEDPAAWETRFYTNPREAINEVAQTIEQRVQAATATAAADERIWNNFKARHPDLADFREDLQSVVFGNKELLQTMVRTRGEEAAMDLAAQKLRAKFERYADMKKPRKELGKDKNVTPTTTQTGVTPKKTEEKSLSMVEQMNMMKEKRRR